MSDQQQGPGWWQASDGKWYPPDSAPPVPPADTWATTPTPGPPPRAGMSTGGKVALAVLGVVVALVLLGTVATVLGGDDTEDSSGSTTSTSREGTETTADDGGELPAGFELIDGDGVSIAVPTGWELIDAEDASLGSDELAEAFPDAPPGMVEQGVGLFEQGAVLVAFDLGATEFASNVNVIRVPGEAPLDAVEDQAVQQLGTLGGEVVESGIVDTALGEALRIEYTLEVALPDGTTLPAQGVQYYMPIDGDTYIITVSSGDDAAGLAEQMLPTFEIA